MSPTCRYQILEYFKSETSRDGVPLLLILEVKKNEFSRSLKAFIPSSIGEIISGMQPSGREWILSLLGDLCRKNSEIENSPEDLFSLLSTLSIGPLRSSRRGMVEFQDVGSALNLIRSETAEFSTQDDPARRFFRLQPLDEKDLQSLSLAQG